jgi:hypothetical protein
LVRPLTKDCRSAEKLVVMRELKGLFDAAGSPIPVASWRDSRRWSTRCKPGFPPINGERSRHAFRIWWKHKTPGAATATGEEPGEKLAKKNPAGDTLHERAFVAKR